ncbi:MAG: hypothetical protein B6242_03920 [Anaerolineaceae bacterium 4572_78]|nr:MAG: hypothetical protein B6242_03920 [Anaerolineaceae bacterium 4572_78]
MSEALEKVFVSLVEKSWDKYYERIHHKYLDDMLVGAVIASNVEMGYSLIDLNSDGVNHYLRFEHLPSKKRLIFQLTNLTEDIVSAKVLGKHARVVIGYGQMISNVGKIWQAFKAEVKSGLLDKGEPGVITFDADVTSGYIYAQVPLILDLEQYFEGKYKINHPLLEKHISAVTHSLAKYLAGRLGA